VLCAFDVTAPTDSSPETPDDRRLIGAIACDGMFVYVLNCYGIFKIGTGLGETIMAKVYAGNTMLKARCLYIPPVTGIPRWILAIFNMKQL
jgi:hypothetical protein